MTKIIYPKELIPIHQFLKEIYYHKNGKYRARRPDETIFHIKENESSYQITHIKKNGHIVEKERFPIKKERAIGNLDNIVEEISTFPIRKDEISTLIYGKISKINGSGKKSFTIYMTLEEYKKKVKESIENEEQKPYFLDNNTDILTLRNLGYFMEILEKSNKDEKYINSVILNLGVDSYSFGIDINNTINFLGKFPFMKNSEYLENLENLKEEISKNSNYQ